MSLAVLLEVSGSNWDITWHYLKDIESFFTPPHSVIYLGVVMSISSVLYSIFKLSPSSIQRAKSENKFKFINIKYVNNINNIIRGFELLFETIWKKLLGINLPLRIAIIGSVLQLLAGPFDYWWHNKFGFDGLLSPTHFVLAMGMLLIIMGALYGLNCFLKPSRRRHKLNIDSSKMTLISSLKYKKRLLFQFFYAVAFSVTLMVVIGIIFMFTLPFSKGQYFDFNPNPIVAVTINATLVPFVIAGIMFIVTLFQIDSNPNHIHKTNKNIYDNKVGSIYSDQFEKPPNKYHILPFTTIIISLIMIVQLTTAVIPNPIFTNNSNLYLLNIIPAGICDLLIYSKNNNNNIVLDNKIKKFSFIHKSLTNMRKKDLALIVSVIISASYITLYYPWSFDLYKHYLFGLDDQIILQKIVLFQNILWTTILPIIIPTAIVMSLFGGLVVNKISDKLIQK